MQNQSRSISGRLLLLFSVVLLLTPALLAQDQQPPKAEIYGGYLFQDPGAKVGPFKIGGMAKGFEVQSSYFFNKFFGLTGDTTASFKDSRANIATIMGGPTVRFPKENITPFLHALVGLHRVIPAGGLGLSDNNGLGITLGGGLDYRLNRLFDLRVIEADYAYAHHNFATGTATRDYSGGRIGAGIVFKFGPSGPPPPAPAASCSVQPGQIQQDSNESIAVTATPQNFDPKAKLAYSWTSSGGKVSGTDATAHVDTTGLAPGTYNVTANVSGGKYQGKPAAATCTGSFTVTAKPIPQKPVISCSANPSQVYIGEPSRITATASSPDNRPVNVTYASTGGRVTGSGNTATLDTAGSGPGTITVTCTATDDRPLSSSADTSVTVRERPKPPEAKKLANDCDFTDNTNKTKPARVNNTCKQLLDDAALALQRASDSKAVLIGHATKAETTLKNGKPNKKNETLAAQRAINAKDYLVNDKGIDPNRIEVRTDSGDSTAVEIWGVPPGATFTNGSAVSEGSLKAQPRGPRRSAITKKPTPAKK